MNYTFHFRKYFPLNDFTSAFINSCERIHFHNEKRPFKLKQRYKRGRYILARNFLSLPDCYEFVFHAVLQLENFQHINSKLRFSPAKVLRFCMHDSGGSETPLGSQSPETRATRIP